MWSHDNNAITNWLSENLYTSNHFVIQLNEMMAVEHSEVNEAEQWPRMFFFIIADIIADEATDIYYPELNLIHSLGG